jgi:gluconate 5-dehydrogenase
MNPIMSTPSFGLAGRRALVTGSSQGIGLALASALAGAGAQVTLNGRDAAKLAAAAAALRSAGHASIDVSAFDATDEAAVQAAATAIGAVDILVNNTGINRRGPLEHTPLADWNAVLQTNLTSAFLVARAFAPGMITRGSGKIINICSLMSDLARPTTGPYAAAKGGLKMLTRAMCAEWAKHNLQVNGIAPGYILTPLTAPLAADPKFDTWIKSRTPAGRWGGVADLAGACVFLASPAADFINGQILTVDGGLSAVI